MSRSWSRESFWGPVCVAAVTGAPLSLHPGRREAVFAEGMGGPNAFMTAYVRGQQRSAPPTFPPLLLVCID